MFFKNKNKSDISDDAKTNESNNTSKKKVNTDKPKKPKKPKKSKNDAGEKAVEQSLSQLAKDLGIRISSPYGYYPEDVDPIILELQHTVSELEKENKKLAEDAHDSKNKLDLANSELSQLRMQMALMEVPDLSTEEEFAMLGKIDSITGNYDSAPISDIKQSMDNNARKPTLKIKVKQ